MIRFVRFAVDRISLKHDDQGEIIPGAITLELDNGRDEFNSVPGTARTLVTITDCSEITISEEFVDCFLD